MQRKTFLNWLMISLLSFFFTGCGAIQDKQTLADFNNDFKFGQHEEALNVALSAGHFNTEFQTNDMFWALQAANVISLKEDYKTSNFIYNQAEGFMKDEDTKNSGTSVIRTVEATLINNSVNNYQHKVFDSVMINTYKGLNDIFTGDLQKARVEFNRAEDRQRRAKEHFAKKISQQSKEIAKEESRTNKSQWDMSAAKKNINKNFTDMAQWEPYGDYINPYTDYLRGLYFMLAASPNNISSDYGKAVFSLTRAAGSQGNNATIAKDLTMAKKLQNGSWQRDKITPQVWIIFENGLAPTIDEIIIPIPLFLVTDEISYAQIALPKLVLEPKAYDHLVISADNKNIGRTVQIASIDRVVQSEFKKDYSYMITKAIASTIVKGVAQHVVQKQLGDWGALAAALYQMTTTHVDTRSWTALPKEVQALRIRKPESNWISINGPGMIEPVMILLPDKRYSIVHVRAAGSPSQPVIRIASFE